MNLLLNKYILFYKFFNIITIIGFIELLFSPILVLFKYEQVFNVIIHAISLIVCSFIMHTMFCDLIIKIVEEIATLEEKNKIN